MNKDFRVAVSLPSHPKAILLMRKLGPESFYNLIRLWAYAAMNKPDGKFPGNAEDVCDEIEIGAGWNGKPGIFFQALQDKKTRFLDEVEEGFGLHDWEEHNEFVTHAKERSERAKIGATARWKKRETGSKKSDAKGANKQCPDQDQALPKSKNGNSKIAEKQCDLDATRNAKTGVKQCDSDATRMQPACNPHTKQMQPECDPQCNPHQTRNAPSPSPSPSPSPTIVKETPGTAPGDFSDFKKAGPKNVARKVKPKNATKDTAGYFQDINRACLQICDLPAKKKPFNPYEWAQKQITQRGHPGAVAESLQGLVMFWASAESPWSYASTILKTKNGNWNEADAIKIHEEMKALNPKELEGLTQGLFKTVKGDR